LLFGLARYDWQQKRLMIKQDYWKIKVSFGVVNYKEKNVVTNPDV
jgi:hypothetical protein